MQRWLLAIIGLTLTVLGGWLTFAQVAEDVGSIMFRSGIVVSVLALALPQVQQFFQFFPPWLLACGLLGVMAILVRPKSAVFVLPILAALWFLGPRSAQPVRTAKRKRSAVKR